MKVPLLLSVFKAILFHGSSNIIRIESHLEIPKGYSKKVKKTASSFFREKAFNRVVQLPKYADFV